MTRLYNRRESNVRLGGGLLPNVLFDSDGLSETVLTAAEVARVLQEYPAVVDLGLPGVQHTEATAGNASVTYTVPTGKYWRLVAMYHVLVTDANVANRAVVALTRTAADATITTVTHANVAASTTAKRTTLFGTDDYVLGNEGVAAQGKLQMATKPTATDTIVLNGVTFTFVAALTGAANELLIGADIAASQAACDAAFVDRDNGGVLHSVSDAVFVSLEMTGAAFGSDEQVLTANVKGTAGNALTTTETFTDGTDTFDAVTLGTETAGVDAADKLATVDYPAAGGILTPGEDINVAVTNGVAGDSLDTTLVYVEFDADPR